MKFQNLPREQQVHTQKRVAQLRNNIEVYQYDVAKYTKQVEAYRYQVEKTQKELKKLLDSFEDSDTI
jgi:uncharacterized protein YlxW (UPF0749 family)